MAAAVTAQSGADLDAVADAAAAAGGGPAMAAAGPEAPGEPSPYDRQAKDTAPRVTATVSVVNPLGLHARPVAALIRSLTGLDVTVTVGRPGQNALDLRGVLRVVAMAFRGGDQLEVTATGRDAVTAAATVTALITGGFGEKEDLPRRVPPVGMGAAPARLGNAPAALRPVGGAPTIVDGTLTARPGAPGLAIGPLVRLNRAPLHVTDAASADSSPDAAAQTALLDSAIAEATQKLLTGNQFEVAHGVLLADPEMVANARQRLSVGSVDAASAWWSAVGETADRLAGDPDELVASRAVDVREAGAAVLAELGVVVDRIPARLDGAVVFADDVGPGEVPVLLERGAVGVVLSRSSTTAHAVIVARGLGLPMILQAGDDIGRLAIGTELVLDGDLGTVQVDPDETTSRTIRQRIAELDTARSSRIDAAKDPVFTPDGRQILVVANIGSLADAKAAVASGADGVGLLRTELLVLDRETYPDEETQTADLTAIFEVLGQRPIVVRVLDAGGDKPVTALDLDPVHNGFLGVRGLRYLLAHPEVLQTQLRAILRAAVGHRVAVMAPMVSVAAEATAFRVAVDKAVGSLVEEGVPHQIPEQIGVMIEVPAAALAADEICAVSDFVSIGTNDLTSYTMAADRTEAGVADLLDPGSTAVQRLIDQLCRFAMEAGTPVAVCGEIAGMTEYVPGLVARGVHELSVAPARIPVVKELLRLSRVGANG